MIKPIVKDEFFLSIKSEVCTKKDIPIAKDLMDTLSFHKKSCVGLAANMIGYSKRMIIVDSGFIPVVMINPKLLKKEDPYQTMEECLSLVGSRKTTRYRKITVQYFDTQFKKHIQVFSDISAQIIQHEMDHLEGIII